MKRVLCLILLLCAFGCRKPQMEIETMAVGFEDFFEPKTLRVDLFHSGTKSKEFYAVDEFVEEPVWAGSRKNLIDRTGYGEYHAVVLDGATGKAVYSRGYSTIFNEWQTTDEATETTYKTYGESVMIPYPKAKVMLRIDRRGRDGKVGEVFRTGIDPANIYVRTKPRAPQYRVSMLAGAGEVSRSVDVLVLAEGYAQKDVEKLRRDLARFTKIFFSESPYKENREKFNLRAVESLSMDSGPVEPRKGIYPDTALNCSFNTFETERYVLCADNKRVREAASLAPYDALYIMLNTSRYGGGGIYNLYSTFVSDSEFDDYVFLHEFGHSFGGLGDEYYTSTTAYSDFYLPGVEPWEPNITELLDPKHLKWGDLVEAGVPVPTPPDREKFGDKVGCFEGAGYAAKGLYRPAMTCKMFSKGHVGYCPVCGRAVEQMIKLYSE